MDLHVYELLQKLTNDNPAVQKELDELVPLLGALTGLLGAYAQGGVFRDVAEISEADFQKRVLLDLRVRLGKEVQEHGHQAGGITDLRYRGVIVELKVEVKNGDRCAIAQKYSAQVSQYEAVEGRQVGVLLVLDTTPKVHPPGDIRNDIILVDVRTHGGPDEQKKYQSKAFVFIVNGNTRKPSSYSR